jgi:hypothetical protein
MFPFSSWDETFESSFKVYESIRRKLYKNNYTNEPDESIKSN